MKINQHLNVEKATMESTFQENESLRRRIEELSLRLEMREELVDAQNRKIVHQDYVIQQLEEDLNSALGDQGLTRPGEFPSLHLFSFFFDIFRSNF